MKLTEAVIYGHAALILGAAAWTLAAGGHVRVDIFYGQAGARARAAIDLAGSLLLLLPFMLLLLWLSVALRRTLLGDPGALAGRRRPAAGVPAQDDDPGLCRADGAARRGAGDPGGGGSQRRAQPMNREPR